MINTLDELTAEPKKSPDLHQHAEDCDAYRNGVAISRLLLGVPVLVSLIVYVIILAP